MGERLSLGKAFGPTVLQATDGATAPVEETLVVDSRAGLRPAEMVERQLISMMRGMPLHVSHISATQRRR